MNADTTAAMYSYWREWFAQPEAEKLKLLRSPGKGGFYPLGSESPGYTGKPDPKEYFHFRWPLHSHLDTATEEVFHECYDKARDWLEGSGLKGLDFDPRLCVLRILHYLPTPDGCAGEAHRDFDLLTVSVPGTCPGLEVLVQDDVTHPTRVHWVPQEEGIQIGEMLEIYTHDWDCLWREPLQATTHRVRTAPNVERFKAVFFYLPPNEFELRDGYTAGDYLKDALTKAGTIGIGAK